MSFLKIKMKNRRAKQILSGGGVVGTSGRGGERYKKAVWESEYGANIVHLCMKMEK
jgi:hypothetical protein